MSSVKNDYDHSAAEALFFGLAFALLFYGITCAQVSHYYWHYAHRRWVKCMVAMLWSLDSTASALNVAIFWGLTIKQFANPYTYYITRGEDASSSQYLGFVNMLFIAEFCCTVRFRIRWSDLQLLRRSLSFPFSATTFTQSGVAALSASYHCRFGAAAVRDHISSDWIRHRCLCNKSSLDNHNIPGFGCPMGGSICRAPPVIHLVSVTMTDIMMTTLLYVVLNQGTTASRRTGSMLKKLNIYIIERGLLTTAAQILEISAYLASLNPSVNQYLWLVFQFIDSKVYVNSVLALLNARKHLRGIGSSVGCTSTLGTFEELGGSHSILEMNTM